jgi:hypothetical protein
VNFRNEVVEPTYRFRDAMIILCWRKEKVKIKNINNKSIEMEIGKVKLLLLNEKLIFTL